MEATGRSMAQLKKELEVTGDMGSVAAASRGSQRTMMAPKRLTVQSVRASPVQLDEAGIRVQPSCVVLTLTLQLCRLSWGGCTSSG